ncbi:MAG: hypothetical protein M1168_01735 [Candidatus Marsarchaeota archaeon]|nr:hypothetical protein [Candidatus Marsarchaeota archaeon]MCL5094683.1 hypothetical protein [Candidatus Marsarchaeota archaeon]
MMKCINEYIYKDKKEAYEKSNKTVEFLSDSKIPTNINFFLKKFSDSSISARIICNDDKSYSILLNDGLITEQQLTNDQLIGIIAHEETHAIQNEKNLLNNFLLCTNLEKINDGIIESAAYFNGMVARICNNNQFAYKVNMNFKRNKAELIYSLSKQLLENGKNFVIEMPKVFIDSINLKNLENTAKEKINKDITIKDIGISVALISFIKEDYNFKKTAKFLLRQANEVYEDLNKLNQSPDIFKIRNTFINLEEINNSIFKKSKQNSEFEVYKEFKNDFIIKYVNLINIKNNI